MIEVTQKDRHQLVIIFFARFLRRKFHTNIVSRKPMHGPAAWCFLEEHLGGLADMAGIERLRFLVGELQQAMRAQLLILIGNDIGDAERCRSRSL